ncbi:universal stress protein [Cellulomonas sp.]|uniref:universal stress protein n=1 Tax=Cellulomonas sp. TaxID=40001 RepID=UPI0028121382|nr:universal stress protein [Cellulomonas sp.]
MDGIVVAVGGSAGGQVIAWAAAEARDAGLPLTVLHVLPGRGRADERGRRARELRAELEERSAAACSRAGADVTVHVQVEAADSVADVLRGTDAQMLVVGRHGRRRSPGRIGTAVLEHARVPVTVVPHDEEGDGQPWSGPVVVGVDGSRPGGSALRHGAEVARRREGVLEAVLAWQMTTLAPLPGKEFGYVPPLDEYERHAGTLLDRALAESGVDVPQDRLVRSVVHAPPGRALLEAAARAERVVVGHRGRSGLDRVLLGSVSRELAGRAACPVTVVR